MHVCSSCTPGNKVALLLPQAWQAGDNVVLMAGVDPTSSQQLTVAIQCTDNQQTQQLLQALKPRQQQEQHTAVVANGTAKTKAAAGQPDGLQVIGKQLQEVRCCSYKQEASLDGWPQQAAASVRWIASSILPRIQRACPHKQRTAECLATQRSLTRGALTCMTGSVE